MYIAAVTHDIKSNTLEATWLKEVTDENGNVSIQRARCHNYSPSQKAMFLADVEGGEKWTTAAGWTDEYCAEYTAVEVAAADQQGAKSTKPTEPTPEPTPEPAPTPDAPVTFDYIGPFDGNPNWLAVNLRCSQLFGTPTTVQLTDVNGTTLTEQSSVGDEGVSQHVFFSLEGMDLTGALQVDAIVVTDEGTISTQTTWSV